MTIRVIVLAASYLIALGSLNHEAVAQVPYSKIEGMRSRVADRLFPLPPISKPYAARLVLRFSDPDHQMVLLIYPGFNCELVNYSVGKVEGKTLFGITSKMLKANPSVQYAEIAARFRVNLHKSAPNREKIRTLLEELKKIRISPFMETRIAVDEPERYDYWYDSEGETVHYSLYGPFESTEADRLVQWMIKFRSTLE